MTLNGVLSHLWHISTSGLIFIAKLEICMADLLFDYEVWRRLRQVLCVFMAKTAYLMQNCENWGLGERVQIFYQESQKALSWPKTRVVVCSSLKYAKKCDL